MLDDLWRILLFQKTARDRLLDVDISSVCKDLLYSFGLGPIRCHVLDALRGTSMIPSCPGAPQALLPLLARALTGVDPAVLYSTFYRVYICRLATV